MTEGKFDLRLISGFGGSASESSLVEWIELVCEMCLVKHLEHIIS